MPNSPQPETPHKLDTALGFLPDRLTKLVTKHKQVRYLVAGGLGQSVEYALFLTLFFLTHRLFVANSISFLGGLVTGYYLHRTWTFKGDHQLAGRARATSYVAVACLNLVLTNLLIGLIVYHVHLPAPLAKIMTMAMVAVWTYVILNKIVFRTPA